MNEFDREKFEKRDDNVFDEFDKRKELNDQFGKPSFDEFKTDLKDETPKEESTTKTVNDQITIAPPTEAKTGDYRQRREDSTDFVWKKLEENERMVNRFFILAIISVVATPLQFCCICFPVLNVAVLIIGFIYRSNIAQLSRSGSFTEFDYIRINEIKKKTTWIIILGIVGIVITGLIMIISIIIPIIASMNQPSYYY